MPNLEKLFKTKAREESFSSLEKAIFLRIEKEKSLLARKKIFISSFSLAFSSLATFSAFFFFGRNLWQSEFWNMLSLLSSDASLILGYWQQFGLSLLETFPAVSAVAILLPSAILFLSLGYYLDSRKMQKRIFSQSSFA